MVTLNAHYDGKTIVPDEPVSLAPNQKLRVTIETIDGPPAEPTAKREWTLGSQPDLVIYAAPDWADPLPDSDWAHNDPDDRP